MATRLYLAELDSLSKELQQVNINWTDVELCLQRTRAGIAEIDDDAVFAEAELCSDKMCIPLTITLCMSIHNTRNLFLPNPSHPTPAPTRRSEEIDEACLRKTSAAQNFCHGISL